MDGPKASLHLLLMILFLNTVIASAQGGVEVSVIPGQKCVAGFTCEIAVRVVNRYDDPILLDTIRLFTPWGIVREELGLKKLPPESEDVLTVKITVPKDYEGPGILRPSLRYFRVGRVGMNWVEGEAATVLVEKAVISADLHVAINKRRFTVGEIAMIRGTYSVKGLPKGFTPSLKIYTNGTLSMARDLNATSGDFSVDLPLSEAGNLSLTVSLCYHLGCTNETIEVMVVEERIVVTFDVAELKSRFREIKDFGLEVKKLYNKALSDGIQPDPDAATLIALADSRILAVERLINKTNMTYSEYRSASEYLNNAENYLERARSLILSSYRKFLEEKIDQIEPLAASLSSLDRDLYASVKQELRKIEESVSELKDEELPDAYRNLSNKLSEIESNLIQRKRELQSELLWFSFLLTLLLFVAMVSTTILILRRWRRKVGSNEGE